MVIDGAGEPTPPTPLRFFYVDDSGTVDTGYIVYSWIEVTPDQWRHGLRTWLDLRKSLYASHQIPPSTELHASPFVNGRGEPSLDPEVNRSKARRREAMQLALDAIGNDELLRIGTVYRRTPAKRRAYSRERAHVYEKMINHLEARLTGAGELGMVFMDGSGDDPSYRRAHRGLKLAHRRIIEDPPFQGSHVSQWVQMADLVAWTAYQSLLRHPGKRFAWEWYDDHLADSDINDGPMAV